MESKVYTIDRFESDLAVLLFRDDETIQVEVPRSELPDDVKEGTILEATINDNGQVLSVRVLEYKTAAIRQEVQNLLEKIVSKNK